MAGLDLGSTSQGGLDRQQALQFGLVSPLWPMFLGAASAGLAFWGFTRWMRLAAPDGLAEVTGGALDEDVENEILKPAKAFDEVAARVEDDLAPMVAAGVEAVQDMQAKAHEAVVETVKAVEAVMESVSLAAEAVAPAVVAAPVAAVLAPKPAKPAPKATASAKPAAPSVAAAKARPGTAPAKPRAKAKPASRTAAKAKPPKG